MQKVFGPTAQRSPKSPLHHVQPCFATVQPKVAPVQEAFRSLGSKDRLHPPLTTFGDFPIFDPSPRRSGLQSQFMKTRGFLTRGFAISELESAAPSRPFPICKQSQDPDPPFFLAFFNFLAFFVFRFSSLFFLCVFPSFSKDFGGSAKRKTLALFGVSLAFVSKKQGLEGQGMSDKDVGL